MPTRRALRPRSPRLGALGAAIRQLRKAVPLTHVQLAERTGIHKTHISGIERGQRNPTYETLGDLAEGLGTTLGVIIAVAEKELQSGPKP